jgi:hypothetical protein
LLVQFVLPRTAVATVPCTTSRDTVPRSDGVGRRRSEDRSARESFPTRAVGYLDTSARGKQIFTYEARPPSPVAQDVRPRRGSVPLLSPAGSVVLCTNLDGRHSPQDSGTEHHCVCSVLSCIALPTSGYGGVPRLSVSSPIDNEAGMVDAETVRHSAVCPRRDTAAVRPREEPFAGGTLLSDQDSMYSQARRPGCV